MQVFIEYVVLAGVNDQPEQAVQLAVLLRGFDVTLNLIPWNPIYSPGIAFEAPQPAALSHFRQLLVDRGVPVTVRQEKGSDISGTLQFGQSEGICARHMAKHMQAKLCNPNTT